MNPLKLMLSAAALTVAAFTANAQTADDIIAKHLDAIGGKDLLTKVNSMVIESTANVMGNDNPATATFVAGKGYKTEMEINGQKMVQTYTDKGGWAINPFQGGTDAAAMPDAQYQASEGLIYIDPFLDYAAHGDKAVLKGTEGSSYKIEVTNKDNVVTTYYIDNTTYFITKAVRTMDFMGNPTEITYTFSDQRKTDFGNTLPFATEMAFGSQFSMTSAVKKVTVNGQVDPKVFDMPK